MTAQRPPLTTLITALAVIFIVIFAIAAAGVLRAIPPDMQIPATAATEASTESALATPSPFAADVEARVRTADPSQGEVLFLKYNCDACHGHEDSTGPYVIGLGTRAGTRRPGYSAAAY